MHTEPLAMIPGLAPGADAVLAWPPLPGLGGANLADPAGACDRAEALERAGDEAGALRWFRTLAADPTCPTALLGRVAAGLAGLGDHASALDACRELARREPGRAESLFGVAHAMRKLGFPAAVVVPIADRVVEIAPGFLPGRALLAAALIDAGRRDEAADVLADAPGCTPGGACRVGRMLHLFRDAARAG